MSTQTWFITGASSGLGASTANAALRAGHRVAVTARDNARLAKLVESHPDSVLPLSMDLTNPSEIKAAVAAAEGWHGGIDVLVNNAAIGYKAAIEEGEEHTIRALFDANVFGVASTIRAALSGMRARASGTIINISSLSGVVSMPGLGYYSASKHALEGLTDALRAEVAPLGIKVVSIEPGGFRTGMAGRNLQSPRIDAYGPTAHAIMDFLRVDNQHEYAPGDPDRMAQILMDLVKSGDMPERLSMGADSWTAIMGKLDALRAEYEKWKDVSYSTYFS
ncbi:SDR family NAD(P)-dependent oxidoreductase [Rhizobiaceae bacterium n13]|uniref:SDR family NAD(P)-dependent oxidoreductase n=1 Tax=Ferirhizobium litorale TaxID=2927786 RepID=A0AAE3QG62_9HYPH|nr:SDR family NAD(P)-dependent oxidoreductase [Fererhizobium litorale]MDI7865027.1 SDR family NAD(P)-dependent oxidoreductase [Fererhizobium litorale]MDI7925207.1 SDR family NAD(P)-dependent oxidoreductase [Fererhizobium litorale]